MSLSTLSSTQLKELVLLVKYKEELEAKLAQVKQSIDDVGTGTKAKNATPKKRGRPRGSLKDAILKALEAAGKTGSSVKDLAASMKENPGSVSVWFYTTGKKIKGIKKIGPGRYSYSA